MSNPTVLDKTFHVMFHVIMKRMVETGQAPFYTGLAATVDLSVEEGRKIVHDLFSSGIQGWLYPRTDLIVSFAPREGMFNSDMPSSCPSRASGPRASPRDSRSPAGQKRQMALSLP